MKTKITTAVLLAVTLIALFGALNAFADGSTVAYLDNQSHTLAANASALYKFDYAVDTVNNVHPVTTITLPNGAMNGLGFQVWTPDKVGDMADNTPIGVGSAQSVDCNTGDIAGGSTCQSPDLIWSGAFGTSGTYYVLVTNSTNASVNYTLNIQGSGVSLGQQLASAPSAPAAAPAITTPGTDDPAKATAIDGQSHSVPAGSAAWYSFNYGLNDDGTHPVVLITLPNGAANGLAFQVWTQDEMTGGWYNNTPIGVGSAQSEDCDTGNTVGGGGCQSPDLIWKGALGAPGTYFVRVINGGSAPANAILTIQ